MSEQQPEAPAVSSPPVAAALERESYGRIVRETWVDWAKEQDNPKPSWLVGWDELDDGQREVDMRIGSAISMRAAAAEQGRAEAAEAKLAAIRAYCRDGCEVVNEGLRLVAIVRASDILAIISSEEEN